MMSNTDDRTNKSDATTPRGRRGGRAPRGSSRGCGFHFNLDAQMAPTQHMVRRGRGLQLAATDAISLTIDDYHDAPLNARKLDKNVFPTAADRNTILETDPIYLYHPSSRQDLQSPFALTPLSPAHILVLIETQYLTGVHSAKDPNVSTYKIYMYLPHDINHKSTSLTILNNQLTQMQYDCLPTSLKELDAM